MNEVFSRMQVLLRAAPIGVRPKVSFTNDWTGMIRVEYHRGGKLFPFRSEDGLIKALGKLADVILSQGDDESVSEIYYMVDHYPVVVTFQYIGGNTVWHRGFDQQTGADAWIKKQKGWIEVL